MDRNLKLKIIVMGGLVALGAPSIYLFFWATKQRTSPHPTAADSATAPSPEGGSTAASLTHELAALKQQLEKKPGHAPILLRMAEVSRQLGKNAEATSHLRELVAAEPSNLEARLELGRALFESGDPVQALAETEKILQQDSKHADALYNLGAIHGNLNNAAKAKDYWNRLITAHPDSELAKNARKGLEQLSADASH